MQSAQTPIYTLELSIDELITLAFSLSLSLRHMHSSENILAAEEMYLRLKNLSSQSSDLGRLSASSLSAVGQRGNQ